MGIRKDGVEGKGLDVGSWIQLRSTRSNIGVAGSGEYLLFQGTGL